jgi:hypothetical protein
MDVAAVGLLSLVVVALVVVLTVIWIVLPFIVMGTNKRLDTIIELLKHNNRLLFSEGKLGPEEQIPNPSSTQKTTKAFSEEEIIKLLEEENYFSAQEAARKNFGMTEREFSDLYYRLKAEGKVREPVR